MRKIKVGMIDSGINQCVIKGKVTQEIFCGKEGDAYRRTDINGHGSMCAGIIERMVAPELEFKGNRAADHRGADLYDGYAGRYY